MIEINKDIIFVKGAKRGAIYDFNQNKVFSINAEGCTVIEKAIVGQEKLSETENSFLINLKNLGLWVSSNLCREIIKKEFLKPVPKLSTVWLEITQACNLRCVHCYEGTIHQSVKNALSLDEWINVIDQLALLNISNIIVIGGEPCTHPQLTDILSYLAQKELSVTLFTNATLMNKELLDCLVKNKIRVKVSIYGASSKTHDTITKIDGSFKKMKANVEFLTNNDVEVAAAVIAMKENQEELEQIKSFVKSIGAKYSRYDVIRNVFGGCQSKHKPTSEVVLNSVKFCKPNFSTSKESFSRKIYTNTCWMGKMVITENGDVLPCVFERNWVCGNIRENLIENIINSKKLLECWYWDFSKVEECKDCEYRFACKDCRPLGISNTGKLSGKNPRCQYNPYTGIWKEG